MCLISSLVYTCSNSFAATFDGVFPGPFPFSFHVGVPVVAPPEPMHLIVQPLQLELPPQHTALMGGIQVHSCRPAIASQLNHRISPISVHRRYLPLSESVAPSASPRTTHDGASPEWRTPVRCGQRVKRLLCGLWVQQADHCSYIDCDTMHATLPSSKMKPAVFSG